jgi:tRNA U34 5-methylaminomethyl-2-thiouridine-forming methyltransferase MnmC
MRGDGITYGDESAWEEGHCDRSHPVTTMINWWGNNFEGKENTNVIIEELSFWVSVAILLVKSAIFRLVLLSF